MLQRNKEVPSRLKILLIKSLGLQYIGRKLTTLTYFTKKIEQNKIIIFITKVILFQLKNSNKTLNLNLRQTIQIFYIQGDINN